MPFRKSHIRHCKKAIQDESTILVLEYLYISLVQIHFLHSKLSDCNTIKVNSRLKETEIMLFNINSQRILTHCAL